MLTASSSEDVLVVRVEDGGSRTPSHRRKRLGFGNNRHFKDDWLMNTIMVDRIREQEMVAKD